MNEKPDNGLYMVRMKGENVQKSSLVKSTLWLRFFSGMTFSISEVVRVA